jgi:HEAT repeat protein
LDGGEIERLDEEEELDYLEIRLQKLESKDYTIRRKSAEALAPYIKANRYMDEVRERFSIQPPHPADVLADGILGPQSEKNACQSSAQALGTMGPAAAPYASRALAVLMSHTDEELRWEAARALGYLGPGAAKDASQALARQLDPDAEGSILVRFVTARSLGLIGPGAAKGAAAALATALEDKDRDVQLASARSLAQIGPNAAPYAATALVKTLLEGTFEMRRLAAKALISMGEAAAGVAAYPVCRVLNAMGPGCRGKHHPMLPHRKPPPKVCDMCQAVGPFARGTDYRCQAKCKFAICKDCYGRMRAHDPELQRLCADALFAMGAEIVKTCQLYLSRALGDADEEVRERSRKALEMAGCETALGGSMALYDPTPCPCGAVNCALCKNKAPAMLEDETKETPDSDDDPASVDQDTLEPPPETELEERSEDKPAVILTPPEAQAKPEEATPGLPKPEPPRQEPEQAEMLPQAVEPLPMEEEKVAKKEETADEEPIVKRGDPWGAADRIVRNRKPLTVETGHSDRVASKLVPVCEDEDRGASGPDQGA